MLRALMVGAPKPCSLCCCCCWWWLLLLLQDYATQQQLMLMGGGMGLGPGNPMSPQAQALQVGWTAVCGVNQTLAPLGLFLRWVEWG